MVMEHSNTIASWLLSLTAPGDAMSFDCLTSDVLYVLRHDPWQLD